MINVMCIFIFVNWDTLVPWAYQLCCLPSINNTIQYWGSNPQTFDSNAITLTAGFQHTTAN